MSAAVPLRSLAEHMSSLRREVLSVYRQILRAGRSWTAKSGKPEDTQRERQYIIEEAGVLFRHNKMIKDENEIRDCISEAETRLTMALHYRIPYPRPVNFPPQAMTGSQAKKWKAQERLKKQSRPIYIKSLD